MLIKLYQDYTAACSEKLLGYMGETQAREITFTGLEVAGADMYKMRFQYTDGVAHEVDITGNSYKVDGSLLRTVGFVDCQICACRSDSGGNYQLVKKSNIFKLEIKNSLNNSVKPIPTFEQSQEALDKIINNAADASADRQAVEIMKNDIVSKAAAVEQTAQEVSTAAAAVASAQEEITEKSEQIESAFDMAVSSANSAAADKTAVEAMRNEVAEKYSEVRQKAEEITGAASTKLDKNFKSENLFNAENIFEGYVRNGVNRVKNEAYFTTEDIPVDPSKESLFCGIANGDGTLTEQKFRFALFVLEDGTTRYTNNVSSIEIPSNAVSFTATFANSVKENKIFIGFGTSCEGKEYQPCGSFSVLEKLVDTSGITSKNTAEISVLNSIKNGRISDIMKPLFTDGASLQIKLIGDSITMGAQGTGVNDGDSANDLIYTTSSRSYYENTAGHCWANSLRDYLSEKFGCTVKNYGVTGATSWSILNFIDSIVRAEDDICIVCIGINDRVKTSKETTYNQIKSIYDKIISKGKRCVLMSEIPVSAANESKYDTQNYHCEDVDIIYQKLAAEKDIEYIPLYKLMNEYTHANGIAIDSLLAPDGLHPNDKGYGVIFGLVSNALGVPTKFENPTVTFSEIKSEMSQNTENIAAVSQQLTQVSDDVSVLKSEKKFRLIETVVISEENIMSVTRTAEPDGTAYDFEKLLIKIHTAAGTETGTISVALTDKNGAETAAVGYIANAVNTTERYANQLVELNSGAVFSMSTQAVSSQSANSSVLSRFGGFGTLTDGINGLIIRCSVSFPVGSTFEIYGVRR